MREKVARTICKLAGHKPVTVPVKSRTGEHYKGKLIATYDKTVMADLCGRCGISL